MNKRFAYILLGLLLVFGAGGCQAVGGKSASLSVVYGATAVLALVLLVGYLTKVKEKDRWFVVLFTSVAVVNAGYFLLSVSTNLSQALMANRLSYLGSVFLPLSMLMSILQITGAKYPRWLPQLLIGLAVGVFLIAASPGILDIYYKEVSFTAENGVGALVKTYGPLHSLYLYYLLGYFGAMVWLVVRSSTNRQSEHTVHAGVLAAAVFVNIGVWFIEQISNITFEMLSVSYILSECFLLCAHMIMQENERLKGLVQEAQTVQRFTPADSVVPVGICVEGEAVADREALEAFVDGVEKLTHTEKLIYEAYVSRMTTKEVMTMLDITENTLKYHNKNIYSKLGVSSRKELLAIYKQLMTMK